MYRQGDDEGKSWIRNGREKLDGRLRDDRLETAEDDLHEVQQEISRLLQRHARHDFQGYKSKTFFRRVARRMEVTQTSTLEDYLALLRRDPDEVISLFRDLLIGVTDFFRDPDAFDALKKQVIPRLLEDRGADEIVRVWVPGCATGEEVFSLAILLHEQLDGRVPRPRVQVFATDIDDAALGVARAARYPEERLRGLSADRKARYFREDGATFVLSREVREMCIFSPHSVISDPPFSQMDMVSCRNLLIYLGADLQQQVLPTFHYALKPGGYLFLGASESVGRHDDLFAPVDKKQRIYRARDLGGARRRLPMPLDRMSEVVERLGPPHSAADARADDLRRRVERQVWDRHAPAHVAVDRAGDVVHFSPQPGDTWRRQAGRRAGASWISRGPTCARTFGRRCTRRWRPDGPRSVTPC